MVQRILYELPGYLTELTDVDAVFGPNTTTQVKNFQGNHGRTRDGIVGTNTWTDLEGKIKYSRFNGYGTGIYCVTYKVNGTECIKMWNMSQETNYKYDWEVLDRMGTYREVQTLLSDRLIMT